MKKITQKRKKDIQKNFRFSVADAEKLKSMAEQNQMSESAYIRFLLTNRPSDHKEIKMRMDSLINEVHKIGVNINQIAYACNVNPVFYNKDREKLMYYMRDCRKLLMEVMKYCNHENDAHVAGKGKEPGK
ncbi:MAG: plasmid mobilization relaxosome protein MobC [Lachnospiraceae bacterium]|nr:plasmid mobilization relaxosome protein MobC [Lachnospiraceae bacterium]